MIGYLSRQDGCILPAWDRLLWSHARLEVHEADLKIFSFWHCQWWSRKNQQKIVTTLMGLLCYKHSSISLRTLKINKSLFILMISKPFCFMINSLLAKLGWSRRLDVSLILFLAFYGTQLPLINKNTQKNNRANIQACWPHAWSIKHINSPKYCFKTVILCPSGSRNG